MTPEQIELVKTTWAKVAPISDKAAELFYGKLFELDPELKKLFKNDMAEQGKKLMQMLGVAVANLASWRGFLNPYRHWGVDMSIMK